MTEWIWINGDILPMAEASISVEDRGFQFADGVYEVVRLYNGRPFTLAEHLARLGRSAAGVQIAPPMSAEALTREIERFIPRAGVAEGMIYLQLTRGAAPRNHVFPRGVAPTLLFYCRPLDPVPAPGTAPGLKLITVADERWKKCWIKSIALLPNVLAKNQALAAGADEAVFVDEGVVTECSTSNLFAVVDGTLLTHPVGSKVLPGVTRDVLLDCAKSVGVAVEERPPTEAEVRRADEIFITSTTREVSWVKQLDDRMIGSQCGPIALKIHHEYQRRVKERTTAADQRQPATAGRLQ
jgi:D-alanine transaminase